MGGSVISRPSEHAGAQSDVALFKRLCPADREGKMSFAPVMLARLHKLGIDKRDPALLTVEEQSRCGCFRNPCQDMGPCLQI